MLPNVSRFFCGHMPEEGTGEEEQGRATAHHSQNRFSMVRRSRRFACQFFLRLPSRGELFLGFSTSARPSTWTCGDEPALFAVASTVA